MAAYRAASSDFSDDPDFFRRYTEADPRHRDDLWLMGEFGGEPVTALRVFDRELIVSGGRRVRLGGIGNVGTHPDHLGRGYATELLRRSIEMMVGEGFELSLLYTGVPALYAQLGWVSLRLPARKLVLREPLRGGKGSRRIEEVNGDDCRLLSGLYDGSYGDHAGALARDGTYWARWIGGFALNHYKHRVLVALGGDHPVAYVAGKLLATPDGAGELKVAEGAALPGEEGALVDLVHVLGEGAGYISWPEIPWLTEAFAALEGEPGRYERDGGMLLPLREGQESPRFDYLLSALDAF